MKDQELASALAELAGGSRSQETDWRAYYHAVRERIWIPLLCLVLGAIGAAIYISRQETKFQARSVLFIEQEQDRVLSGVEGVRKEQITSVDMINTVVDLLRSYPFALRVAERVKLHEDPRFREGLGPQTAPVTVQDAAGALFESIAVQYRRNTRLIDISVTNANPEVATALANAYADEYLRSLFEKRTDANKGANQFLLEEAERLRKKMRVSEEAMQSFRERERAASLETVQEGMQSKIAELSVRAGEIEQRIYQLETDLKVARANPDNPDELLRLPSVAVEPKVARLTEAIAVQERDLLLLSQRYRAKHPAFVSARTQLDSLIADRKGMLRDVVSLLETARKHLDDQQAEVSKAREDYETRLLAVSGKFVEYNDLRREVETDSAMHQSVLGRIKEIDLTKGLTDSPVRVHERAAFASRVGTTATKIYTLGLVLALGAGIAIPLLLHTIDQSVKTVEHAEHVSGLPVLAAIPKRGAIVAREKGKGGGEAGTAVLLDTIADRNGIVAESFRSLRASVAMLAHGETRRSFLFTSAMPSEGKTFSSTNFAVTLAQQGFRTLLVDADLRKPMVSNVFFGEHRKPGLADVLSGQVAFEEAVIATEVENLSILTAGSRAPNPAELLATRRMTELLEKAVEGYDRLVIDTAPALAVSDALLLAPHVSVTCLVIRAASTPTKTIARAVKALSEINCRPAGIILNFLPSGAGSYYYYSGRYYGSYTGKGVYGAKA